MKPRLIFCADGNPTHARIAVEDGWLYGARLPGSVVSDLPFHFADQDWKKPNRAKYMAALAKHRPAIASVLDWEREEQLPEVLDWAGEASQHVREAILIIPKVPGGAGKLPVRVKGRDVWLGYSVPSSYGNSRVLLSEFAGRSVHLLGGSPQAQYRVWDYLRGIADVVSLDGNMAKKMATGRCCYWTDRKSRVGHWQNIRGEVEENAPDECLRRTLCNVREAWEGWVRVPARPTLWV